MSGIPDIITCSGCSASYRQNH